MAKKGTTPWNKGIKTGKPSWNTIQIDKDTLYDLYINQELSTPEIGRMFNCSATAIRNKLNAYGIPTRSNGEGVKAQRSKWSDEQELARSRKFHNTWMSKSDEERAEIAKKKTSSPNVNSPEAIAKAHITRKINKTSKGSKSEEEFYRSLLLMGFNEDEIDHPHINDPRYPFSCDFYIEKLDLFIEYQGHDSHGPGPFDKNNEDHLKLLVKWEDEANAGNKHKRDNINTWTKRDPMKLQTALDNKINLLLIYPKHTNYLVSNGHIGTADINDISKM